MSMLDSFFNKGFKGAKCKTLLKLTIPRIKLLRNKREIQLKQMRRDIAKLLENGQEATARIRVEHIIREENMMAAQEIMELFCELIAVRLPIIETQRECPLDLKEAISSICFAAPRCSDLPELQQVQMLFAAKYGREFVAAASELMPDCGVNRQIIELLSIRAPSVEAKLKLLKEIAEEHEVDWDPAASETEFLKPHEDLLNGPNHIISGSTSPLPKEQQDGSITSEHTEEHHEEADSDDAGFDSLDFPEVPKASVRSTSDNPSAPEINFSTVKDSAPHPFDTDPELNKSKASKNIEADVKTPEISTSMRENKQYVPFVASPPPPPPFSLPSEQSDPTLVISRDPSPKYVAAPPPPPFSLPSEQSDRTPFTVPPPPPPFSLPSEQSDPTLFALPLSSKQRGPTSFNTETNLDLQDVLSSKQRGSTSFKTETNIDLQDVLAAAQAAAESADRAASAARAAASLAQVRISELITKKNEGRNYDGNEKKGSVQDSDTKEFHGEPTFDQQNSFEYTEPIQGLGSPTLSSDDVHKIGDASLHQPQRSFSIEEDPYFSYPNLFNRQASGLEPDSHSKSGHEF